jgi:ketosteroid isomerase-like protein
MGRDEVMRWVERYERAWRDRDADAVEALFSPDAQYLQSPYEPPHVGLDAIKAFWSDDDEDGEAFTMSAEPVAVDVPNAVVRVEVHYGDPVRQEYRDLWVLRFAPDGRVELFEEWAYWPDKPFYNPDPTT